MKEMTVDLHDVTMMQQAVEGAVASTSSLAQHIGPLPDSLVRTFTTRNAPSWASAVVPRPPYCGV